MEIVAIDIGGTHARFAIAEAGADGSVALGDVVVLEAAEHVSLETAWEAFRERAGRPLPRAVSIAVAGQVEGDALRLTNSNWVIPLAAIRSRLGAERHTIVNDFGAVAHAVARLGPDGFRHAFGPDRPLPEDGVVSIVGPGTGLGVAQLIRRAGHYHVVETEGGHIDFAPLDELEDRILARLRERYRRVSVERVASGLGLANIYGALAEIEGGGTRYPDTKSLWAAATAGEDRLAASALDRFCLALGAFAGDIALAQGAGAVVIAGGLGLRLGDRLFRPGFRDRFVAKGRFERRMAAMPVKLLTCPEPGLFGAAVAFAAEHLGRG